MQRQWALPLGVCLLISLALFAQTQTGRKWAILIGVNSYEYLNELRFCGEDVKALYKVLTTRAGYEPNRLSGVRWAAKLY